MLVGFLNFNVVSSSQDLAQEEEQLCKTGVLKKLAFQLKKRFL